MSPTATTQGVIRGFVIALFSNLYVVIPSGHVAVMKRYAIGLRSESTVNYGYNLVYHFSVPMRAGALPTVIY